MPHSNPGYDVESADAEGQIVRYIEVKSLTGSWRDDFAVLSARQFENANSMDDEFWLYVVERAQREDFQIHRIPNPALNTTEFMFDDGWSALGEEPEYPEPMKASNLARSSRSRSPSERRRRSRLASRNGWTGIFGPIFVLGALFLLARSVLTRRLDRPLATGYAVLVVFYVGACHFAVSDTWNYLSAAVFNTWEP